MEEKIAQFAVLAREIQDELIAEGMKRNLSLEENNLKRILTTVQTECYHYSRTLRASNGKSRRT